MTNPPEFVVPSNPGPLEENLRYLRKPSQPPNTVREHDPQATLGLRPHIEPPGFEVPEPTQIPTPIVACHIHLRPRSQPGEPPWFGVFGFQLPGEDTVRGLRCFLAPNLGEDEQAIIRDGCTHLGLPTPLDWEGFLEIFYRTGFQRRPAVVAWEWNKTYGQLLVDWTKPDPRSRYRGGISGIAWTEPGEPTDRNPIRRNGEIERGVRPRILNLSRGGQRSKSGWTGHGNMDRKDRHGARSIISLKVLADALTGAEFADLSAACSAWDIQPPTVEPEPDANPVRVAVEEMEASARLYSKLITAHTDLLPQRPPHTAMSGGTYAAGLFEQMGLTPQLAQNPEFPRPVLAGFMGALFGGAVFCQFRTRDTPVVKLDFRSLYPVVHQLCDMWSVQAAQRIYMRDADVDDLAKYLRRLVKRIQRWVANPTSRPPLSPKDWERLARTLVWVVPDNHVLPHRPVTNTTTDENGVHRQNIHTHIAPVTADESVPQVLAGVLESILDGDPVPRFVRGMRLVTVGRQQLDPITLPTGTVCDPNVEDPVFKFAAERARLEITPMDPKERKRLRGLLKNMANPMASGLASQVNDDEPTLTLRDQLVWDPVTGKQFTVSVNVRETPGRFYFPPIAAGVQACGRLLLGITRRTFEAAGGTVLYWDTDSQVVYATPQGGETFTFPGHGETPPETITALSYKQVNQVRWAMEAFSPYPPDVRATFDAWDLEDNIYRRYPEPSLLKWEPENDPPPEGYGMPPTSLRFDVNAAKRHRPHHLIRPGPTVQISEEGPMVVHPSEDHLRTLSHVVVVDPSRNGVTHKRPDGAPDDWVEQAFAQQLGLHYGIESHRPVWLDQPAVTLIPASRIDMIKLDTGLRPYSLIAIIQDLFGNQAIAAWHRDAQISGLQWTLRKTGEPVTIRTTKNFMASGEGKVHVARTIDMTLRRLAASPQNRALATDGFQCRTDTYGLLEPAPTVGKGIMLIGKESRRWGDGRGTLFEAEYLVYEPKPDWDALRRRLLVRFGDRSVATRWLHARTGIPERTLRYFMAGRHPSEATGRLLVDVLATFTSPDCQ